MDNSHNLVLKIVLSEWKNESRDKRELDVVSEMGYRVLIQAKGNQSGVIDKQGSYSILRVSTRPLGRHVPDGLNRICSIFTWAYYARKYKPRAISCHDIVALLIGYLSTLFVPTQYKAKLIYDSHEFELGRNTSRGPIVSFLIKKMEKFLMKKCDFSIMVNDSIADEVQKIHKLFERPVVVRNIPEYWELDTEEIQKKRRELCEQLMCAPNTFLIMYHGLLGNNRGIEALLEVIQKLDGVALVLLGMSTEKYIKVLKMRICELKIEKKVLILDAVSHEELYKYIGASDVGMMTIPATCKSYYYALPNKLFENIQSLTPVITSNYPEMKKIVDGYKIGLTVNPYNIEEIFESVRRLQTDRDFYMKCKDGLHMAKKELCWEKEKRILKAAYLKVLGIYEISE